jgi:hypothetical protein
MHQPQKEPIHHGIPRRASSSLRARPPLVGRSTEIALLGTRLSHAARGKGGAIFLEGEAGIGKTRLAQEVLALNFPWPLSIDSISSHMLVEAISSSLLASQTFRSSSRVMLSNASIGPFRLWANVTGSQPDIAFNYGGAGDKPVAGYWGLNSGIAPPGGAHVPPTTAPTLPSALPTVVVPVPPRSGPGD